MWDLPGPTGSLGTLTQFSLKPGTLGMEGPEGELALLKMILPPVKFRFAEEKCLTLEIVLNMFRQAVQKHKPLKNLVLFT